MVENFDIAIWLAFVEWTFFINKGCFLINELDGPSCEKILYLIKNIVK